MITLKLKDETAGGKILNEISIAIKNEAVTVQDIIHARVFAEVERYNKKANGIFNGLVQPENTEVELNGYKLKPKRIIDAEKQYYVACQAFLKNGYFILIDDIQAETLEQEVLASANTKISFIKLTPLVGG